MKSKLTWLLLLCAPLLLDACVVVPVEPAYVSRPAVVVAPPPPVVVHGYWYYGRRYR